MKFLNYGKSYQISVSNHADLQDVINLNEALWAITSAPIDAFNIDRAFLEYLDTDKNYRIRTDEVKSAAAWCLETLSNFSGFDACSDTLDTSAVNRDSPDGPGLLAAAEYVAEQFPECKDSIPLTRLRECMTTIRDKPLNGDGVIVPESGGTEAVRNCITAAIKTTGGRQDISGRLGVDMEQLSAFHDACVNRLKWLDECKPNNSKIMPLGEKTNAAWQFLKEKTKEIDDFFILAGFRDFDPDNYSKFINSAELGETADKILKAAPLARPLPDGSLPLSGPEVNPVFKNLLTELDEMLLTPILGRQTESLSKNDWEKIKDTFAPYEAYMSRKSNIQMEDFSRGDMELWISPSFYSELLSLAENDKMISLRIAKFGKLEKLILCQMYLLRFLNNYVNLSELYDDSRRALFERGSAVIDGRWFNMAVRVDDVAKHSAMAKASGIFVIYLNVGDAGEDAGFCAALPSTSGTKGNLSVGKRGIFIDVFGKRREAVIINIIENPISFREAVFAPFNTLGNFIVGKIERISSGVEKKLISAADKASDPLLDPGAASAAPKSTPQNNLIGISVSLAALGSSAAFITKSIGNMSVGALLSGLGALAAAILLPVSVVGIIKLNRQDLSPILEGCGLAVNQRMSLTWKLRRQFTFRCDYPENAHGIPKKRFFAVILTLLAAAVLAVAAALICLAR